MIRIFFRRRPEPTDDVTEHCHACTACLDVGDWRGALAAAEYLWQRGRQLHRPKLTQDYGKMFQRISVAVEQQAQERGIKPEQLDKLE